VLDDNTAPRRLVLPPPYTPHWLGAGDAFAEARRLAPTEGAGTLVWHASRGDGRAGRFDFSVVLEPETPLAEARLAFIAGMVALGDALAAHCPPERAITFGWPGEVLFDGGRLGGARFAVAPDTAEEAVPDWMVLGVELIADRDHLATPGSAPGSVSLKEEGFTDPPAILESFAAYLMLALDRWTHEGFAPVAARYSQRLTTGAALDAQGGLVLDDGAVPLAEALGRTAWRDAQGPLT
jgi:biotin-(acetyl-CoA carboxylase) ligase